MVQVKDKCIYKEGLEKNSFGMAKKHRVLIVVVSVQDTQDQTNDQIACTHITLHTSICKEVSGN